MKIGFNLAGISPRRYPLIVAKADELGFESCWQPEHLIWPAKMPPQYPYSEDGLPPVTVDVPTFDPWVNLAFAAAGTTQIKFGTNVYILPLRHPFVTARAVITLDYVTGGRAILGCGVGWLEEEFELAGLESKNRGARTDEIVEILKKLWTEDVIEFHGKYYDFGPVKFQPKPVAKPHPPIEFGGDSIAALRRAARIGDGWLSIGAGAQEEFEERVKQLTQWRKEYGREKEPFDFTVGAGPEPTADTIKRLEEKGATRVLVTPWPTPERGSPTVEHASRGMEEFANRVMAKL